MSGSFVSLLSLVAVIAVSGLVAAPLLRHSSGRPKSKPVFMAALCVTAMGVVLVCWMVGLV